MAATSNRHIQFAPEADNHGDNGGYELRAYSSNATNLSERIAEEISRGVYECPICADHIQVGAPIWSCKRCYHAYHFSSCIEPWAYTKGVCAWKCPTCKADGKAAPVATCWCGSTQHALLDNIGNTCGRRCNSILKCNRPDIKCYGKCKKPCHPGPCDPPACTPRCIEANKNLNRSGLTSYLPVIGLARTSMVVDGMISPPPVVTRSARNRPAADLGLAPATPVEGAPNSRQNLNCWKRFRLRWNELDPGSISKGLLCLMLQAGTQSLIALWGCFYRSWWTRPLEHQNFTEHLQNRSVWGFLCLIILVIMPILFLLQVAFFAVWDCIFTKVFNLRPMTLRQFIVHLLLFSTSALAIASTGIWFFVAPTHGWYDQMKNTCEGFDTRVKLDIRKGHGYIPTSSISLYNPSNADDRFARLAWMDRFEISPSPHQNPNTHRMAGMLFPGDHLAVDFDLQHHTWRISRINDNPTSPPTQPSSPEEASTTAVVTETPLRNGTWSELSKAHPHLTFPSLGLQIPNMHYYTRNCQYMPFMTVFRTQDMDADAVKKQSRQRWTPRSDDNVVMRTASFGHSIKGLEVCAKRDDYLVKGKRGAGVQRRKGLGDDIVVPLGLLAVLNTQMDVKSSGCNRPI